MSTFIMPVVLWAVAGIVSWLAGRYHLDLNQQQQISTDIVGGIVWGGTFVAGMWHVWHVRMMSPPNGGKNVQTQSDATSNRSSGGYGGLQPGNVSGPTKENPSGGPSPGNRN